MSNTNYKATVTRLSVRKAEGLDNLVIGSCMGYQVLVSKDIQEDQIGVLFEPGTRLSEEFCQVNDLVRRKNADSSPAGGMFEENRKTKAIKLRGIKSEGFWIPLEAFAYTGFDITQLKVGDSFEELNGHKICEKYISPAAQRALNREKGNKSGVRKINLRKEYLTFPVHVETEQFRKNVQNIPDGADIMISCKLHGSSGRYAHCLVEESDLSSFKGKFLYWLSKHLHGRKYWFNTKKYFAGDKEVSFKEYGSLLLRNQSYADPTYIENPLSRQLQIKTWEHRINLVKYIPTKRTWKHLNGSRNVILENNNNQDGFYGKDGFRQKLTKDIILHKGEVIYFEIVGYTDSGKPIMNSHSTTELKDKKITKAFGQDMVYKYGCLPGTCAMYVYRIAMVNEDGVVFEYSWDQVEKRCKELGLRTVPVINRFTYNGEISPIHGESSYDGYSEYKGLTEYVNELVNGKSGSEAIPSCLDPSHLEEGVVVRYDSKYGTGWLKEKNFVFKVLEGIAVEKETEETVDMEEIS